MSQLVVEATDFQPNANTNNSLRKHFHQFKKKNDKLSAKKALLQMLARNPSFHDALELVRIEFEEQDHASCLKSIEYALSIKGSELRGLHEIYRIQGACLIHLGQFEKAEDVLYKALEYPGEADQVLVNLGTLDIQRKEWESATMSFREALRHHPNNDKAWVGLSLCHRFKGDHDLAYGNLLLALDICPRNETALGLLLAWYGNGKENDIYQRLTNYLIEGGENQNLWLAYVELAFRKGDTFAARMELERLKLTHPEFVPAYQLRV